MEPLSLFVPFLRGEAYLKANRANGGPLRSFRRYFRIPESLLATSWDALAHLELARALVSSGDIEGARSAYRDFLKLWKNADPDIPVFQQAKSEYANLH